MAAVLRHDAARRRAGLPDPHRAVARPRSPARADRRPGGLADALRGAHRRRRREELHRRPGTRSRPHRRADRHLCRRARSDAAPEPLLPVPRHRRLHRRLGRPRRRHGRAHRRSRPVRPRGRGTDPCPARGDPDRDRRNTGRGHRPLTRFGTCRRGPQGPRQRLSAGARRPPRGRTARPGRGRAAEGEHAAHPAAPAARPLRRSARGLRRDVPHRRGVRTARRGLPGRRGGAAARRPAVRDLLPLADRPVDPRPGPRHPRVSDPHPLRPAHPRPALRRRQRSDTGRVAGGDPRRTRRAPGRAGHRLPGTRRERRAVHRGEDPARPGAGSAAARRPHLPPGPRLPLRHGVHRPVGVETAHANVLLCGAGAVRGGGVSGVPGHNAAMAALGR